MFSWILLHAFPPLNQPHHELLCRWNKATPCCNLVFAQWDSYFFKLLEEILICFEEELCVLTSRLLFGFALYLWLFSEQFSLYVSSRGHLFITSTKKIEREGAGGTKFWLILLMVVLGFFGEGDFLSVMWLSCVPLLPRG